ncbi:ABC transporter substrate-binding protein [Zavarzinia sp. CC-PAN008]|uniref:ABC transporter substrate-binding protein n=1 Tax=Zavarzinia sp. CC-PAN008 TaxID=3243332 RepID=UPI003F749954
MKKRGSGGFQQDLMELAADRMAKGALSRRDFLQAALLVGGATVVGGQVVLTRPVSAAAKEIVVANFGGDGVAFWGEAWGQPFTADTGIAVKIDGASPLAGKIKAMVESGKVTWDACDADGFLCDQLGNQGILAEVDYTVIDKAMIRDGWAWKHGFANYTYSFVLAYNKETFPAAPPTWMDFFDTAKYPGKRTMWKWQMGAMEACLLADGVPPDQLYPLDVDRAIRKAKSLGDNVIYWDSGAESQDMFLNDEVVMGNIWNTRASVIEKDTDGKIVYTWAQGIFCPGAFVVPKGNPAGADVNKFLASTLKPERQIKLLELLGNGPSNPAASANLPPELQPKDPGFEANLKQQIYRNEAWYTEHYDAAVEKWVDGISG